MKLDFYFFARDSKVKENECSNACWGEQVMVINCGVAIFGSF